MDLIPLTQLQPAPGPSAVQSENPQSLSSSLNSTTVVQSPDVPLEAAASPSIATPAATSASNHASESPTQSPQPLHCTVSNVIWKNMNVMSVVGVAFAIAGIVWAVKSFNEAALANKLAEESNRIAQEEVCRNHPVCKFRTT